MSYESSFRVYEIISCTSKQQHPDGTSCRCSKCNTFDYGVSVSISVGFAPVYLSSLSWVPSALEIWADEDASLLFRVWDPFNIELEGIAKFSSSSSAICIAVGVELLPST